MRLALVAPRGADGRSTEPWWDCRRRARPHWPGSMGAGLAAAPAMVAAIPPHPWSRAWWQGIYAW